MSETLWGVVIGGLIASITPVITIIYNHYKWKNEQKLEYLKSKKEHLEREFKKTHSELAKATINNIFPMDVLSDINILFPNSVAEEFEKLRKVMTAKKSEEEIKFALFDISVCMKKELSIIQGEIEAMIGHNK